MIFNLDNEEGWLVKRCMEGDRHAQYQLYNKYFKAMYNTIVRMVPQNSDAEDVLQETFVHVFQKLNTFKGESTLGAWIKRIAINSALNFIRSRSRKPFSELDETMDPSFSPEWEESEPVLSMHAIHEAVKHLPEGCRVIFSLFLLEGYQHQEIAQILNISVSTSKSQYQRARLLLQQQLKSKVGYDKI